MSELAAEGVAVDVPAGWDGRIFRRPEAGEVAASAADGPPAPTGEVTSSVTHLATVPLPAGTGDFGGGAVEELGPDDVMVALLEYDPSSVGTVLFAAQGLPRALDPEELNPGSLQRTLSGQAGVQRFFTEGDRPFCLYVVIGSYDRRYDIVPRVNEVLATMTIEPRAAASETSAGPTILDVVAGEADLTTIESLLPGTGVDELLASPGPLTLFAPSDDAFAASGLLDALRTDSGQRTKVLMHLVVRDALPAGSLADGQSLPTVEGQPLAVETVDGRVTVGGAGLARPDLAASNGVVHVIDAVLVPPASPPLPTTTAPPAPTTTAPITPPPTTAPPAAGATGASPETP